MIALIEDRWDSYTCIWISRSTFRANMEGLNVYATMYQYRRGYTGQVRLLADKVTNVNRASLSSCRT